MRNGHQRYTHEEQIIKKLDKALAQAKAIEHEVVVLDAEIRKVIADAQPEAEWKINQLRDLQLQLSRRANRIMTTRIKNLSDKLVEFRTKPMPFIDGSVAVRVRR